MIIDPKNTSVNEMYTTMVGSVMPRPIAFASTISKDGNVNLSPFSFFNAFGSNPPVLIFSPAHRTRDNTPKDSYLNVKEHPEVVINMVDYTIAEQMSLSSTEYERGVDEFEKSGLTAEASIKVKPPRVKESPVSYECKVLEVKSIGNSGGSANLVICEVLLVHVKEELLNEKGYIDPYKADLIGRLGGPYYTRITPDTIFTIKRPTKWKGIGVDSLPKNIKESSVLTGSDLARLGNLEMLPTQSEIDEYAKNKTSETDNFEETHSKAKDLIRNGKELEAIKLLMSEKIKI
ncbi:MAG: flavin reductase family protein [Bacteroidota bacterium]